jgi:hypothetical protein
MLPPASERQKQITKIKREKEIKWDEKRTGLQRREKNI